MIAAAKNAGFEIEGTLRQASWSLGGFADTVVMGLLAAGRPGVRALNLDIRSVPRNTRFVFRRPVPPTYRFGHDH